MPTINVKLNITREQYLDWYRGAVKNVLATSVDGRSVQFPCSVLQPFVTNEGIEGLFVLVFDNQFKFQSIHRVQHPPRTPGSGTVA